MNSRVDKFILLQRSLTVAALAWVTAWCWYTWGYWEDDAYIHAEYARNVLQGQGFMFNGVVSNGDTSPAWVILLAAAFGTGAQWLLAGKTLSIVATAFTLVILWRFAIRLQNDMGLTIPGLPAWMVALFVTSPYFCYWSFSGMEAVWAAGWLMLQSMLLTPRRVSLAALLAACLSVGLGPVIRPELILMFPVAAPFLLKQGLQLVKPLNWNRRVAVFLLAGFFLALPVVVWIVYALEAFGYVLPNTNAAKQAAPGSSVLARLTQVVGLGFPGIMLAVTALASSIAIPWLRRPVANTGSAIRQTFFGVPTSGLPLASWVFVVIIFYQMNHTYVQTRYALVLAPGLTCLLWVWCATQLRTGTLALISTVALVLSTFASLQMAGPHLRNKIEGIEATSAMADYIKANVPRGEGIAVYSIGQYGFLLRDYTLIDIGGITRPEAAEYLFESSGRKMLEWAKKEGATYYISGDRPEEGATLLHSVSSRALGWHLRREVYEEDRSQSLWRLPSHP